MDLDYFNINDYTNIGDNSLIIELHSGNNSNPPQADAIIMNNLVLVLNSEVPDATISGNATLGGCDERDIILDYTVYNTIATDVLPEGTPIAFYADDILIGTSTTDNDIEIGGSENGTISLTIPDTVHNAFTLILSVNDDGTGESTVIEFNEENNTYEIPIIRGVTPTLNPHDNSLEACDSDNNQTEIFDLTQIGNQMVGLQTGVLIRYYTSEADANAGNTNNITTSNAYNSGAQTIFVRMEDVIGCYIIAQFELNLLAASELT